MRAAGAVVLVVAAAIVLSSVALIGKALGGGAPEASTAAIVLGVVGLCIGLGLAAVAMASWRR